MLMFKDMAWKFKWPIIEFHMLESTGSFNDDYDCNEVSKDWAWKYKGEYMGNNARFSKRGLNEINEASIDVQAFHREFQAFQVVNGMMAVGIQQWDTLEGLEWRIACL